MDNWVLISIKSSDKLEIFHQSKIDQKLSAEQKSFWLVSLKDLLYMRVKKDSYLVNG